MRRIGAFFVGATLAISIAASGRQLPEWPLSTETLRIAAEAPAVLEARTIAPKTAPGVLTIEIPVVGRLVGGGGVLYRTSLDIANFSSTSSTLDFFLNGTDLKTSAAVSLSGTISDVSGQNVFRSTSGGRFDDFIDSLVQLGLLSSQVETDGFLGSLTLVFPSLTGSSQAAASARFFSAYGGGTIGVAVNGYVLTGSESQTVVGLLDDTRGLSTAAQLYPNLFLTNIGHYSSTAGAYQSETIQVRLSAYSATSGQAVGSQPTIAIGPFQTASISSVRDYLGISSTEPMIIVYATVTSGASAILGVGAEVDGSTKDPSGFYLAASSGAPAGGGGGTLSPQNLAGNWSGTWNNTTFGSTGPISLSVTTNTTQKTYSATLTLGGTVFGGNPPPPQTFGGSYVSSTNTYTFSSSSFGNVTYTFGPGGALSGSATNVPNANISRVDFTGTLTATTLNLSYTITFTAAAGGGTAHGTVSMTKS